MRTLFFIYGSILLIGYTLICGFTSNELPSEVRWEKDFKMTKSYFQMTEALPAQQAASIHTRIGLMPNYMGTYRPRVYAYFNPYNSYMLKSLSKDQMTILLNHEKRHFDIAEYMARACNSVIYNVTDTYTMYKVFAEYQTKLDDMQKLYDAESDHCNNIEGQIIWDKKLDSLLELRPLKINPQ